MTGKISYIAMLTDEKIEALKPKILCALRKIFPTIDISDIDLVADEDYDGDPILRVYINYTGKIAEKGGTRATAIDKIRDILEKEKDLSFPVMTFIASESIRKRAL